MRNGLSRRSIIDVAAFTDRFGFLGTGKSSISYRPDGVWMIFGSSAFSAAFILQFVFLFLEMTKKKRK